MAIMVSPTLYKQESLISLTYNIRIQNIEEGSFKTKYPFFSVAFSVVILLFCVLFGVK